MYFVFENDELCDCHVFFNKINLICIVLIFALLEYMRTKMKHNDMGFIYYQKNDYVLLPDGYI